MLEKIVSNIISFKWVIIALSLVSLFVAGFGMKGLTLASEHREYFDTENPKLAEFDRLSKEYNKDEQIIFIVRAKDGGTVFRPKILQLIQKFTEESWRLQYVRRVDSIANYQHVRAEEDELIVEELIKKNEVLTDSKIANIKAIALSEPRLYKRIINAEGTLTAVVGQFEMPGIDQSKELPSIANDAKKFTHGFMEEHPEILIGMTGVIPINFAFIESSIVDMTTLIPLCFLIVIVGVGFFVRDVSSSIATLLIIFMSIIITMGLAGWKKLGITSPTLTAPIMIMTLAVADCLHFLSTFMFEYNKLENKNTAILESYRQNLKPIIITSVTTMIGFASLNFSDSPPFRHLGNLVVVGVFVSMVFSITLLPALLTVLPTRKVSVVQKRSQLLSAIGKYVSQNNKKIGVGIFIFSVVCLSFIPKNEINDVFNEYFSPSMDIRKDTDLASGNIATHVRLIYSLPSKGPGEINSHEYLYNLEKFVTWLNQQKNVFHVASYLDTIKNINKTMHQDNSAYYKIPESRELAAQYALTYELSLPFGLPLTNEVNLDKSESKISVSLKSISSKETLAVENEAAKFMKENLPVYMQATATSAHLMISEIGQLNIISMLKGTLLALALISLLLVFALKSVKYGIISLIPNLLPAAIGFGLWGMFVGQIGLSLASVLGITMGVVVDFSVHFISKYRYFVLNRGLSPQDAIQAVFSTVGVAVFGTTLILVLGFGVLAFSPFKLNSDMGILTSVTIAVALLVDFLLLPTLLLFFDRKKTL